jgi:phosphoglycolate phosphatase-like HAD superfamily hydrolase
MHLVMFDIDGTLVDSTGFDGELYAEAVRSILKVEVDRNWDAYEHVSDSGILEQLLRDACFDGERAELAVRVQQRFVTLVRDYLTRQPGAVGEIAGARHLVERLLSMPRVRVAVATGGWGPTALLKLRHIGIDVERLGFASSSDAPARVDIMRLAAQRAMHGAAVTRTTYFGDGPWDRRASAELEYDFVAVGTAVRHSLVYADLSATDAILEALGLASARRVSSRPSADADVAR